jgi:hypothetical protein
MTLEGLSKIRRIVSQSVVTLGQGFVNYGLLLFECGLHFCYDLLVVELPMAPASFQMSYQCLESRTNRAAIELLSRNVSMEFDSIP